MSLSSIVSSLAAAAVYVGGLLAPKPSDFDNAGEWAVTIRGLKGDLIYATSVEFTLGDLARYMLDTSFEDLQDEAAGYAFYGVFEALEEGVVIDQDCYIGVFADCPELRKLGLDYFDFLPDIEDDKVMGVKLVSETSPVL